MPPMQLNLDRCPPHRGTLRTGTRIRRGVPQTLGQAGTTPRRTLGGTRTAGVWGRQPKAYPPAQPGVSTRRSLGSDQTSPATCKAPECWSKPARPRDGKTSPPLRRRTAALPPHRRCPTPQVVYRRPLQHRPSAHGRDPEHRQDPARRCIVPSLGCHRGPAVNAL